MKANLIRIGNSQGIRIPTAVIEQCGFGQRVEMTVEGDRVVVTRAETRGDWDRAFQAMAEQGGDVALLPDRLEHGFDETEW